MGAHVSGATRLSALDPYERRFSVHPLQTLTHERGPEQLDGAWAAISAETDEALAPARWLAQTLGLHPFVIADVDRTVYHAAAVIGGNFLVTLHQVATRLLEEVGAPPEALAGKARWLRAIRGQALDAPLGCSEPMRSRRPAT